MAQIPTAYLPFPAPIRQTMDESVHRSMNQQPMQFQPIHFQPMQYQYPSARLQIASEFQHEAFMQPEPSMQWPFAQNQYPHHNPRHYQQRGEISQSVYVPQLNQFVPSINSVPSPPLNLHLNLNIVPNPMSTANQVVNPPVGITPTVSSGSLTPALSTPSLSSHSRSSVSPRSSLSFRSYTEAQQTSMKERFIVIFDWDDTLFPTSSIIHKEESDVTLQQLYRFGKAAYELLNEYITVFGHRNLYIVTNGAVNWVLTSLQDLSEVFRAKARKTNSKITAQHNKEENDEEDTDWNVDEEEKSHVLLDDKSGMDDLEDACNEEMDYFAAIHNSIMSLGIDVISAQDLHAAQYPQQSTLWKTMVFKKIVKEHFCLQSRREGVIYTIISIGDSEHEFVASHEAKCLLDSGNRMNRSNNISRLHRIKLRSRPNVAQMMEQMKYITEHAHKFANDTGSTTIRYE